MPLEIKRQADKVIFTRIIIIIIIIEPKFVTIEKSFVAANCFLINFGYYIQNLFLLRR